MPTDLDRNEVQRLIDTEDAHVVEVLPATEYEEEHLPGAINLPLAQLDGPAADRLRDSSRPVVVYCFDHR